MILVCDPGAGFRDRMAGMLEEPVGAVQGVDDLEEAATVLGQSSEGVVLLLGPGLDRDAALDLVANADRNGRPVGAVLFLHELDPAVMRTAMRAGVVDVLLVDTDREELVEAVQRARAEVRDHVPTNGEGESFGRVVTVFSTKGGCGKSLVASNLAILLAKETGEHVALVDLDLQSGDLAIMLQVMPALSIYDAAQNIERMDTDALQGYLTPHQSGVSLLAAPLEPSLAEAIRPEAVSRLVDLLRRHFGYVVIDGPAFFTDQVLASIDLSDQLVLVGSLDVPSVKNLRMALSTLHQLGHGRDRILTVLNRADSNVGLRIPEVEKSLGTEIDVRIPSSRDVPLSVNQGSPLAAERRKSAVVEAIQELVPRIVGDRATPANAERGKGRSLFGFGR